MKMVIELNDMDLKVANHIIHRKETGKNEIESNNVNDLIMEIFRDFCKEYYDLLGDSQ